MARRAAKAPEVEEIDPDHPRLQSGLFGQAQAEAQFLEAYNADRLHHAWLLHGPKGVGKATFAYRAAKFLLAEEKSEAGGLFGAAAPPESLDRPADDPGCRRVAAASHADLTTLEPKEPGRQILVETADRLANAFHLTPGEGAWRVAIIDAADDLHIASANKLLKLIEEPPERTVLFLISHNPGRLLPTIRSRCARAAFGPLEDAAVDRILAARRPEAAAGDMAAAVELAGGSAGRALALLDGGGAGAVTGLAQALAARRGEGTLAAEAFAASLARNPFQYAVASETLLGWLAASARPAGTAPVGGLTPELQAMAAAASALGPKPWLDLYDHARRRFERAKAVNLDPAQTLVDILARIQALLARVETRPT